MPFDATDFPPKPSRGEPSRSSDNTITALIIAISVLLLVTPLSLAACSDIVRYVGSR